MTIKIATWNINSVRLRIGLVERFLKEQTPDVLCLQEIKCLDDAFPREPIEALGYNVVTHGQKTFNGVAILSRLPLEDVRRGLPGDESDTQARYIEAVVSTTSGVVRIASIYLPNGNPLGTEKFTYKLSFMDRLHKHAKQLLTLEEPLVLAGDYNIIPEPIDAKDPNAWTGDALFQPESRAAWRRLVSLGLTDAIRALQPSGPVWTFWDYQGAAFERDSGLRIDHGALGPDPGLEALVGRREHPLDHLPGADEAVDRLRRGEAHLEVVHVGDGDDGSGCVGEHPGDVRSASGLIGMETVPALDTALGVGDVIVAQHFVQCIEHGNFFFAQLPACHFQHLVGLALEHMVVGALAFFVATFEARAVEGGGVGRLVGTKQIDGDAEMKVQITLDGGQIDHPSSAQLGHHMRHSLQLQGMGPLSTAACTKV